MTPTTDKALLLDAVFGGQPKRRRPGLRLFALIAAVGLHAGLWLLSQLSGPSLETWSARIAAMVHHDLNTNAPTAIETIKLPEPEPEPEPPAAPPASPPPQAAAPQPKAARAAAPQPSASPAQAAQIIAADAPIDLTADTFVTGTASAYAGGATTTRGESPTKVDAVAPVSAPTTTSQNQSETVAQPVSLTSEQWQCPWPADALAQDLYEQFVIVRAWVREDGSVERASVVSDPGYGFGAAAMACALRTRFNPARNARGAAVRSLSPPIRVRFTR